MDWYIIIFASVAGVVACCTLCFCAYNNNIKNEINRAKTHARANKHTKIFQLLENTDASHYNEDLFIQIYVESCGKDRHVLTDNLERLLVPAQTSVIPQVYAPPPLYTPPPYTPAQPCAPSV